MIDEKKKDKHATICKDCIVKIKTTNNESICICSCESCVDRNQDPVHLSISSA